MSKLQAQQGFTLIEMIIAIALSAVVATIAYQSFDGASRSAQRTRDVLNEINQLDKAWQLIGQDMRNILPTDPQIIFQAASLTSKGNNSFQVVMQFMRRGWVNPMGRLRSDLQQVNYRIAEGKLIRDYLPLRNQQLEDMDFERESLHQTLLENVTDIQLRFLSDGYVKSNGESALTGSDYSRSWDAKWPPVSQTGNVGAPPIAVEITIETTKEDKNDKANKEVSHSVRLYELPQL